MSACHPLPVTTICLCLLFSSLLLLVPVINSSDPNANEEFGRFLPSKCESCQIFARELDADTSRLPTKMVAHEAEAWLLDELEQVCERMMLYRLHKEKRGLARFSKQMTGTAKTVKQLKARGVEVKLDVPDELLDRPSIESGKLKEHCEWILEEFEKDIEQWFMQQRHQITLTDFLCHKRLGGDFSCSASPTVRSKDEF